MTIPTITLKSPGSGAIAITDLPPIDLQTLGLQGQMFDVQKQRLNAFSIAAATWANAHIELKWSIDGSTFFSFPKPVTHYGLNGSVGPILLSGYRFLQWDVVVLDASASAEDCFTLAYGESRDAR